MKKLLLLPSLLVFCLTTLLPGQARADVLYSHNLVSSEFAYLSSPNAFGNQEINNAFSLATTATVSQATWYGVYFGAVPGKDTFTFNLYTGATNPNATATFSSAALSLTRTDLGTTNGNGNELYSYSATLATPFLLSGGTPYYLSILDNSSAWGWQNGASGSTGYYRDGGEGTAWVATTQVHSAFTLTSADAPAGPAGTVPDAGSTLALLGLGAAALLGVQRAIPGKVATR